MTISTNRESDRFMLRLPDGMRQRIKYAAEGNNRSMNAEIVAALEEKFPEYRYDQIFHAMSVALRDLPEDQQKQVAEKVKKILTSYVFFAPTGEIIDPKNPDERKRWDDGPPRRGSDTSKS